AAGFARASAVGECRERAESGRAHGLLSFQRPERQLLRHHACSGTGRDRVLYREENCGRALGEGTLAQVLSFVNLCVLGGSRFLLTTKDTKVNTKVHEGNIRSYGK